jgi:RES domain-containing protein
MRIFRLIRKKYGIQLSGKGAALSGNRWNSKGTELIYCADSRALAMAEVAVHLSLSILPKDYVVVEIEIPTSVSIVSLTTDELPPSWNRFPHCWTLKRSGMILLQSGKAVSLNFPLQSCRVILTF